MCHVPIYCEELMRVGQQYSKIEYIIIRNIIRISYLAAGRYIVCDSEAN